MISTDGPCKLERFSDASNVSIEAQRAIHMAVKSGCLHFARVRLYIVEALLVLILATSVRELRGWGNSQEFDAHTPFAIFVSTVPSALWLAARFTLLVCRRRAFVQIWALGIPQGSMLARGKGHFPMPIEVCPTLQSYVCRVGPVNCLRFSLVAMRQGCQGVPIHQRSYSVRSDYRIQASNPWFWYSANELL